MSGSQEVGMSLFARKLCNYQSDYAAAAAQDKTPLGKVKSCLGTRVVVVGVALGLHVDALCRLVYFCFLNIRNVFSRVDEGLLTNEKNQCVATFKAGCKSFAAIFYSNVLPNLPELPPQAPPQPKAPPQLAYNNRLPLVETEADLNGIYSLPRGSESVPPPIPERNSQEALPPSSSAVVNEGVGPIPGPLPVVPPQEQMVEEGQEPVLPPPPQVVAEAANAALPPVDPEPEENQQPVLAPAPQEVVEQALQPENQQPAPRVENPAPPADLPPPDDDMMEVEGPAKSLSPRQQKTLRDLASIPRPLAATPQVQEQPPKGFLYSLFYT